MYGSNTLWNPTRARNFVKEFGGKPTKFHENLAFLANKYRPGMDVKLFRYSVNPLKFLRTFWPGHGSAHAVKWYNDTCKLIGSSVFHDLSSKESYFTEEQLEKYYKNVFGIV